MITITRFESEMISGNLVQIDEARFDCWESAFTSLAAQGVSFNASHRIEIEYHATDRQTEISGHKIVADTSFYSYMLLNEGTSARMAWVLVGISGRP